MNLIDAFIILILGMFVLAGIYKGFLPTVMSLAADVISWASGMIFMPIVSRLVTGNQSIFNMLLYYSEGSEFIGDVELAKTAVTELNSTQITNIVNNSSLPTPFSKEILTNINNRAFEANGAVTLGDYYSQTIVCVVVNIISFLILFFAIRILLGFIIEGIDYSVRLPVLSQLNAPVSAGFGLFNGIAILFMLFMVLPIVLIVFNFDFLQDMVDKSFFTPIFYSSNLFLSLIPGTC